MNARNRVFIILGILALIGLAWYFFSTDRSNDLQLIGTVDANEVIVSSRIPGRIQALNVDEGDDVKAGQLIAVIESEDLAAARNAAQAASVSQQYKLLGSSDTERQTRGSTSNQVMNAEGKPTNEFGVGVFRSGIRLDLATKLYIELISRKSGGFWNGNAKANARELAATAFALSEVFLEEMDEHLRPPPPEPPEDDPLKYRR